MAYSPKPRKAKSRSRIQQQLTTTKKPSRKQIAPAKKPSRKQQHVAPDLISVLSDCLIIHILSFLDARYAVRTCILSKRWINLWKTLPTIVILNFPNFDDRKYERFVYQILSLRDDSTDIHTLQLHPAFMEKRSISLVSRILKYAFSHNVRSLLLDFETLKPNSFSFSSSTLKSLKLTCGDFVFGVNTEFPNSLHFPALTTLSLSYFTFTSNHDGCAEPFSTFNMLTTLIINQCVVLNEKNLCISNTRLESLSITMHRHNYPGTLFKIELCAPNLHTFSYIGNHISKLVGSKSIFSSIKQLIINVRCFDMYVGYSPIICNWLDEISNIESLTLDTYTLEVLSCFPDFLKLEPPSLLNLKSLKIETYRLSDVSEFDRTVDFLLQNSPSAKVEIIIVEKWSKM
ncbi:putative F-box/LRR-repeat protein At3g18150 isoform X2 [Vicia villosa]|uniref:putative F-box/LRR-repeat protein At3g18150 isoform X2 n=1 Tax=Vicia villosa TaxID=3911 RepID=UPI00273BDF5A|nr:putative F-box/LRR-repeat protein At3g18150 isoform X2 [Vicia villosa]